MKPEDIDLGKLRVPLQEALKQYADFLDPELGFEEFPDFYLTPEKPNSARTVVPVRYGSSKVGDMYAVVFLHGDGTGDESTPNKLSNVIIPPEIRHDTKPERVIPRAKTGVIAEGFFPLFSMNRYGRIAPFTAHLAELTLDDQRTVTPTWRLGQNRSEYLRAIYGGLNLRPIVQSTVAGTEEDGNRIGDPHSIYYDMDSDSIQVVAFVTIKDIESPLLRLVNKWVRPPRYK